MRRLDGRVAADGLGGRAVSPSVDPVAFVLGVLGLAVGVGVVLVLAWIVACEVVIRRGRRRRARAEALRVSAPRVLRRRGEVVLEVDDVSWGWPERP